jgi:hypothetical protein
MDLNLNFAIFHGILLRIHYSPTLFHAKFNDFREKFLNLPTLPPALSLSRELKPFFNLPPCEFFSPFPATRKKKQSFNMENEGKWENYGDETLWDGCFSVGFFSGPFLPPSAKRNDGNIAVPSHHFSKDSEQVGGGGGGFSDGI